ncbi:hypothetical protein OO009_09780 [Flavobacteriaceae bacterium KMM 6897]|nr:hypothetical protein [Flavobacteriaceae bacterium KMM 6897]MEB8344595.1 hypothetical protein [Flavobacteriaceae bacterium KMM 6898]
MNYTIYILLAVFGFIFVINLIYTRKKSNKRKSKKFMDRADGEHKK